MRCNISRQFIPHGAGDVHLSPIWILNEVGQVLAVVAVEAHAFEPAEEDGSLVAPVSGQVCLLDDNFRKHDISHIVPNTGVHKLHIPLVREVGPYLVANLLAALVDQVWQVLPSDLLDVHVKQDAGGWHIPCRGVTSPHVEDHVHVLQGKGATSIQELMIPVCTCHEGMVLEEIHLWALLEVIRLPLREQMQTQIVVDAVAVAAGAGLGGANVEILMVPMRDDDLVAGSLVDLRGSNRKAWIGLQSTIHLAREVTLHGKGIIVHQHSVLGLQE
mmetsp:Transcript_17716/g.28428  ORF Transcript_17716/g.28428 Transcript_17716/m.28428 type:complete len:273 (-) Transcript_17716:348-1166(-)